MGPSAPARDVPLALKGVCGRLRVVTAADDLAQRIGVRIGMTVAKVQALFPDIVFMDADPDEDAAALERLAGWALRLSPIVAPDPPDGLVIETAGADHLHGGEDAMVRTLLERFAETGVTACAALSDTWGASHGLARFSGKSVTIIPMGKTAGAILPLPVAALRLPAGTTSTLHTLGFDYIGEIANKPRAPLTLRFGPDLVRRLDQAFGRLNEPIRSVREEEIIHVSRGFMEPISAPETLQRYTQKLVGQLCDRLEVMSLGARRLELSFQRNDNRIETINAGTGRPSRDVKSLSRLLSDKLDRIDPGFGIERMILTATLTEPLMPQQVTTAMVEQPQGDLGSLVDVIANRLGEQAVYRVQPVASDLPERAVARVAPSLTIKDTWPARWPRPTRLLQRPEPVEAMALLPDKPPVAFTWRGQRRRVIQADGPERVFGEWWRRDQELESVRDYFQVVDAEGRRYWMFRSGDGEHSDTGSHAWYMHGIFG